MQKNTLSEKLGISAATVNNWIKTKVIPAPEKGNYYTQKTFEYIINMLKKDQTRLNSRANRTLLKKKALCYLGITNKERRKLLTNIVNDFENSDLSADEGVLAVSFAILRSNNLINSDWKINKETRLDTLLSEWLEKYPDHDKIKNFYTQYEIPSFDDDILGAFYQSVQNISQKSNSGSYYTPSELLSEIKIPLDKTVLDPCCGSGGILLNILTKAHDPTKIFARDIDEIALKICYINLALFFNNKNIMPNISKQDITLNNTSESPSLPNNDLNTKLSSERFDYIVTNPPWGSKFSAQEKEALCKSYPDLETSEIFSIALYNAINILKKNGELYFFLPHSFLNVATHRKIRKHLFVINGSIFNQQPRPERTGYVGSDRYGLYAGLRSIPTHTKHSVIQNALKGGVCFANPPANKSRKISIKLLGKVFKGVLSESILLHIKNNSVASADSANQVDHVDYIEKNVFIQSKDGNNYQLPLKDIASPDYIVSVNTKTEDALLIEKIYKTKHTTLRQETIFALGIVTGNNKKYLSKEKKLNANPIFRGKDIDKYRFLEPEYYIEFQPALYQQVAPADYYWQKKIVYRFISNKLVCALDNEENLLLNSANLFISKNYPMETIVSLFNSDIYTFIFTKKFHSKKVLKSHLQNLPLPILSNKMHHSIFDLYSETFSKASSKAFPETLFRKNISLYQEKIDKIICKAFSINKEEYNYIKSETM